MKSNFFLNWLDFFLPEKLKDESDHSLERIEALRKTKIVIRFSIAAFILGNLMFILRYSLEPSEQQLKTLFLLPVVAFINGIQAFVVKYTGSARFSAWVILIVGFLIFLVRANTTGGINSPVLFWYTTIPVISILILSKQESIIVFFITIFCMYASIDHGWFIGTPLEVKYKETLPLVALAVKGVGLAVVFAVCYLYEIERKKSAEALQQAEQRIAQNNKLTSLAVLSGGVAHEINNPLSVILGNLTKLDMYYRRSDEYPETVKQSHDTIIRNAARIQSIVGALRMFTRDDFHTQAKRINLSDLIKNFEYEEKIKQRVHKDIKVSLDIEDNMMLNLHDELFSRVIDNLVINSTDAIKEMSDPWIKIVAKTQGREAIIDFIDSGPGIPDQTLKKIFDPFFTTKSVGEGTGLGLALVKRIVEAFHGKFSYVSGGEHTQFRVVFPLSAID